MASYFAGKKFMLIGISTCIVELIHKIFLVFVPMNSANYSGHFKTSFNHTYDSNFPIFVSKH